MVFFAAAHHEMGFDLLDDRVGFGSVRARATTVVVRRRTAGSRQCFDVTGDWNVISLES